MTHDVRPLLEHLALDRGLAWMHLARVVGVSVPQVRKWRQGEWATAEQRDAIQRLIGFFDDLESAGIADPASWFESGMPFEKNGYYTKPLDLYPDGHAELLLDLARGNRTAEEVMDEARPGWREQRSDFEVVLMADGDLGIVRRAKDEDE